MKCISPIQFAIYINGQQGNFFKGRRDLKQGDPPSPMLFVITMEYLSRLFRKASMQPDFGCHPHCKKLGLTHLISADDFIIFCKAKPSALKLLMDAFQEFTLSSGLIANLEKSNMVLEGTAFTYSRNA